MRVRGGACVVLSIASSHRTLVVITHRLRCVILVGAAVVRLLDFGAMFLNIGARGVRGLGLFAGPNTENPNPLPSACDGDSRCFRDRRSIDVSAPRPPKSRAVSRWAWLRRGNRSSWRRRRHCDCNSLCRPAKQQPVGRAGMEPSKSLIASRRHSAKLDRANEE